MAVEGTTSESGSSTPSGSKHLTLTAIHASLLTHAGNLSCTPSSLVKCCEKVLQFLEISEYLLPTYSVVPKKSANSSTSDSDTLVYPNSKVERYRTAGHFFGGTSNMPESSSGWPPKANSLPHTCTPVWKTPRPQWTRTLFRRGMVAGSSGVRTS